MRSDLAMAGAAIFVRPSLRRQLAAEIDAQFRAYRATGLPLDHVNAHHHFHLHPTIGGQILDIGQHYGMRALRVPWEPRGPLARIESAAANRRNWLAAPWTTLLKIRVRQRGLMTPDRVFGVTWSGAMTESRIAGILRNLPDGMSEIYSHPATADSFVGAARGYRYRDELAALMSPHVKELVQASGAQVGGFLDFAG